MAEIDILATAQDHPALLGHNMRRYFGTERADYSIPMRDIIDAGILVGGGTDAPVVPIDPFLSMWWMTTRGTLNGYRMGPDQAITLREAIRAYTVNNAYIMGREDEIGSIEVGKLADLVVISEPILDIPTERIKDIRALMTMVGGNTVYRSDGF
jgi:predicted amidohydrolase YtcJ